MELKGLIQERIDCRMFLEKARNSMYICPFCGSGRGRHKTGALKYYADTKFWQCHACGAHGDVIELYQKIKGCDFKTALRDLAEQLGVNANVGSTGYRVNQNSQALTPTQSVSRAPAHDLSEYFAECHARLHDPAAVSFLLERGISVEIAELYGLGFVPNADPAGSHRYCARIVIPTNRFHYVARSTDPDTQSTYRTMNNKGAAPDIFNRQALYAPGNEPVFVMEGAFDALSIIEADGSAIALNSASNGRLLLAALQERPTNHPFLLCLDNDETGRAACANLSKQLHNIAVLFRDVCAEICSDSKDPNEALLADKVKFFGVVRKLRLLKLACSRS